MKKIAAGFLAGVLVATTATAYAQKIEMMVGKVIDGTFPLYIDGKKVDQDVIDVEGTSYLPVRKASELFGYQVDFTNDQVVLKKNSGGSSSSTGSASSGSAAANGLVAVKTGLFTLGTAKGVLVEQDGEQYLSALVFSKYLSSDGTTVTIQLPTGGSAEFPAKGEYEAGCSGYVSNGSLFVSLSALGLSAQTGSSGITLVKKQ